MDAKTFQEVHDTLPKKLTEDQLKAKVVELQSQLTQANAKLESLELVVIVGTDIVKAWPSLTMRGLGAMTKQVDTLKQALEATK